jgi:putative protein-disulfide isomerase
LYIADPMCSWCYGFAPVIGQLAEHFCDRMPVRIMVGGLRAGNARAMTSEDRAYIRSAWTRVNAASGQPFDFAFFDRATFTYDTEPACRAIVAVRSIAPEKTQTMMAAISSAFYASNRDTTSDDVLADVAAEIGIDREAFRASYQSADIRNETLRDFLLAKEMGVEGFPCLLAGKGDAYAIVTNGFRPVDGMIEALEAWRTNADGT